MKPTKKEIEEEIIKGENLLKELGDFDDRVDGICVKIGKLKAKLEGFQLGQQQTLKEFEKMIDELKDKLKQKLKEMK